MVGVSEFSLGGETIHPQHIKNGFDSQKLFGCMGSQLKTLLPALRTIEVKATKGKKGLRCKPKKNSGADHALQAVAAIACGHRATYKMSAGKTPKTLKRRGVRFLEKSTHYDTIGSIEANSVWQTNARILQPCLPREITIVLDFTPNPLEGEYEAKTFGYIGRNKDGSATISECHQLATISAPSLKCFLYTLRLPGNYNPFTRPADNQRSLAGLDFSTTVATHLLLQVHTLYQNHTFFWLMDAGFDKRVFWKQIIEAGDYFITRIDAKSECTREFDHNIEIGATILKSTNGFDYHLTLIQTDGLALNAVYVKPHNNSQPFWLVTNNPQLSGEEIKRKYDTRSGGEPLHEYLKEDFHAKKPASKTFSGAQAHTALACLAHNIIALLSEKILGAYHRAHTLVALLAEQTIIENIFTVAQQPPTSRTLHSPPAQN